MAKLSDSKKEALILEAMEVDEKYKPKYTQQFLADKYGISKGMVNRYVKNKVNKSKQIIDEEVRVLGELENIDIQKSKHLSKQEQIEVNKQVRDKIELRKKTDDITVGFQNMIIAKQNATNMLINKVNDYLSKELENADSEEEIQKLYDAYNTKMEMIINYNEMKIGIEANDKAAITLGVADRHAPKGDVNVQTNLQNNIQKVERVIVDNK